MFRSVPRDQLMAKFLQDKAQIPDAGLYRSRFRSIEPNIRSARISPEHQEAEKVAKIKDLHFRRDVHKCPRIDRTLVYIRNNVLNQIKKENKNKGPMLKKTTSI